MGLIFGRKIDAEIGISRREVLDFFSLFFLRSTVEPASFAKLHFAKLHILTRIVIISLYQVLRGIKISIPRLIHGLEALANLAIRRDDEPPLNDVKSEAAFQTDTLAFLPPRTISQSFNDGEGASDGNPILSRKLGVEMESRCENWEWHACQPDLRRRRMGAYTLNNQRPLFPMRCGIRDPLAVPCYLKDTCFAEQQAGFYQKQPLQGDFGHQERGIQPGPLKTLVLSVKAVSDATKSSLLSTITFLFSSLWALISFIFSWTVVVPVLSISRMVSIDRLELLFSLLLANWVVRHLPGFKGSVPVNGELSNVMGYDGDEWTIFLRSGIGAAIGETGPVLSI
jgi:hypothetical protein